MRHRIYLLYLYSHFISSNSLTPSSSFKPFSLSFSLIFQLSLFYFLSSSFTSLSFRPPLSIFTLPFDYLLPPSRYLPLLTHPLIFLFSLPLFSTSSSRISFSSFPSLAPPPPPGGKPIGLCFGGL